MIVYTRIIEISIFSIYVDIGPIIAGCIDPRSQLSLESLAGHFTDSRVLHISTDI